jgi:hypothetical protein
MKTQPKRTSKLLNFAKGEKLKREPRVYTVIERDGVQTCSNSGWPEDVQDDDTVFIVTFHDTKDSEEPKIT